MKENSTKERRMGRPLLSEGGPMTYLTLGITRPEKRLLEEWAWRLRTNKSQLGRKIILEALAEYEQDANMKEKYPLPEEIE